MANPENRFHRGDLAKEQLRTAVRLFMNNQDLSSVITLSSAANNILSQIIRNAGGEPFIDYACRAHEALKGVMPPRKKYKYFIENILGVNVHKHMSPECPETCTINLRECAIMSLTMAICDYTKAYGDRDDFVVSFLSWSWAHQDGREIISAFRRMPSKLKKGEKIPSNDILEKLKSKPYVRQAKSSKKRYHRFKLAESQLKTAIILFLTGVSKISAITLAGASDVIFCELVNRSGKKNYTDILHEKEEGRRKREDVGKEINNLLFINALKHFDPGDDEYLEIDVEECAVAAILKALVNYGMLDGKDDKLIVGFRFWVKENLDPQKYNLN